MHATQKSHRHILACIIGNILEWYEFSLFAYLSPVLSILFFPSSNRIVSLLSTLLVFAAGFLIRPLGAIFLGHLGDNIGRAKTLKITILLLSLSSILTGFIPDYNQIGIFAPILLILCRLLQGFCIGGEFAGSMIYLSEKATSQTRGFISSMTNNGSNIGVLLAVLCCSLLSSYLSDQNLASYGWRLLFIFGGSLGVLGLWLRKDLAESEIFIALKAQIKEPYTPFHYVVKHQRTAILQVFLLLFISACGSYTLMGYISTYLHEFLSVPLEKAYQIQTLFIVFTLPLVPFFAHISDKIGRKTVMFFALGGYLICTLPVFSLLQSIQAWWVLLPLIILYSAEQAVTPALIVEIFPGKGRYTGISIAYNAVMALVGGLSPAINTYLIHYWNNTLIIAYYLLICTLVSLWAVFYYAPKEYGADRNIAQV